MTVLGLTSDERAFLEIVSAVPENEPNARWARVILLYDAGNPTHIVAQQVGLSRSRTRYIKQKFSENRLGIFPESGTSQSEVLTGHEPPAVTEAHLEETPEIPAEQPDSGAVAQPQPEPEYKAEPPITLAELAAGDDSPAGEYVARQVKSLFDATKPIHQLQMFARRLLIASAVLHRIKSKPKNSQALIMSRPVEGFSAGEQELIAYLVRQQVERHKEVRFPKRVLAVTTEQNTALMLGLLRIAIALDNSHSQTSELEIVSSQPDSLNLRVVGPHALTDATASQTAASLWSQLTGQVVHVYTDADLDFDSVRQTASSLSGPGMHPDDSMAEAGRKVLRYHFLQMLAHEPGTRLGEDIEELHDMRVATRRMRAAFEVFGDYFQHKRLKSLLKGLRATGRALGKVRDLDVFIEKAHRFVAAPTQTPTDLSVLLRIWTDQRTEAREAMLNFLDSDKYRNFVYEMNDFVNAPGTAVRTFDPQNPQPNRVREVAPMLVYTRLAHVRAYDQLLENASFEQLHALRIDFKYLRYTVEFFREVLGSESKAVIDRIKSIQDHLGDLNDSDVTCHLLQELVDSWEDRQLATPLSARENPQPIVQYLSDQANERHRLLVGFPQVWHTFNHIDFLRDLALSVAVL